MYDDNFNTFFLLIVYERLERITYAKQRQKINEHKYITYLI